MELGLETLVCMLFPCVMHCGSPYSVLCETNLSLLCLSALAAACQTSQACQETLYSQECL